MRRTLVLCYLTKWKRALSQVPMKELSECSKTEAFHGDKFLGAAFSKILKQSSTEYDQGSLTKLAAQSLSNKHLASRVEDILPNCRESDVLNDHSVASLIEAAVSKVHEIDEEAVIDLVHWLIGEAISNNVDAKSALLEHGGSVTSKRAGGSDHVPQFRATAKLNGKTVHATGGTKIDSEQKAASLLLMDFELSAELERN